MPARRAGSKGLPGRRAVILAGARTAFGVLGGSLRDVPAVQLGSRAIAAALERAGVPPRQVDYVWMGQVLQAGTGQVSSRQASIGAGLPVEVPSETINKVCASGLRAVNLAETAIRAGDVEVAVAGGMESMSQAPYLVAKARFGHRMGHGTLVDALIQDGLWCPFGNVHMGVHGNRMAREFGISRQEQDAWAYRSHMRALAALRSGVLAQEIVPFPVPQKKGEPVLFAQDEGIRPDTSLEKLASLPPVFEPDGTITAGNAPGINDGAAALVLMDESLARAEGRQPLARILAHAAVSAEPPYLATVPALAAQRAVAKAGLTMADVGLVEVNEAFAAVAIVSTRLAGWDEERVNVNGGAIALGHPIGASGARILLTLVLEMRRRQVEFGLAAICSGAAQGEATLVQLLP
ncbi:MAG: acetyl-CoA C-acetyltransferase [Firmicutes bacterium]|nr:acetyl-CoA C-acetyltransferase [Bacillota bacterium]